MCNKDCKYVQQDYVTKIGNQRMVHSNYYEMTSEKEIIPKQ